MDGCMVATFIRVVLPKKPSVITPPTVYTAAGTGRVTTAPETPPREALERHSLGCEAFGCALGVEEKRTG